jgi:hypothetical protein
MVFMVVLLLVSFGVAIKAGLCRRLGDAGGGRFSRSDRRPTIDGSAYDG